MLVDLISDLVEGVIFGGGRRRRSYKRGTTVFVGGSDIWPGRGSDPWWWEEEGSYKRGTTVFVDGSDIWPGRGSDLWWWEEEEVL
jgi:hypothetical protein